VAVAGVSRTQDPTPWSTNPKAPARSDAEIGTLFSLSKSAILTILNVSEWALLIFGAVLVVGLIIEYHAQHGSRWMKFGEMLVIVGVAGELLGDGGIFLSSRRLQIVADQEIADLAREVGNAKLALATQQERAAKAERELLEERQHSANRDISVEDQRTLAKKLIMFRRQRARIAAFPVNFETRTAAMSLWGILINAKWDVEAPKMLCCAPDTMVQGVYVTSTTDEPSCRASAALNDLLKTTPFAGVFMPSCSCSNNRLSPKGPPPHVYVLVGDKPTPLRSSVTLASDSKVPDNTKSSPKK
jgi:hypothetical protein